MRCQAALDLPAAVLALSCDLASTHDWIRFQASAWWTAAWGAVRASAAGKVHAATQPCLYFVKLHLSAVAEVEDGRLPVLLAECYLPQPIPAHMQNVEHKVCDQWQLYVSRFSCRQVSSQQCRPRPSWAMHDAACLGSLLGEQARCAMLQPPVKHAAKLAWTVN